MLDNWVEMGLDPVLFWTVTPRLMRRILDAAVRRRIQHLNDWATQTYNGAALARQRRLPPVQKMLLKPRSKRPQTWQEQMKICRAMAAAFGSVQ